MSIKIDVSKLSPAARDGHACAVCGRDLMDEGAPPSVPVGATARGQLFACATHGAPPPARSAGAGDVAPPPGPAAPAEGEGCPPWCTDRHAHPIDVEHSTFREVDLNLSGDDVEGGRWYAAGLHQVPGDEPYVSVAAECGPEHWMTLEQAERHARDVLALVEAARTGRAVAR